MLNKALSPVVHARGQVVQLDRVFDLVKFAAHPRPLTDCLDALPRQIAGVFDAAVCSIYLREGDSLVMRGNVGFPEAALTDVRLAIGEGITGIAVEYMRPISLAVAHDHEGYRHFPLLGEERFPVFLAVPLAGPRGPVGALVLQRRDAPPFSDAEIQLAVALTAPICAAVDRSRLVDAPQPDLAAQGGTRRVTLVGRTVVRGRALGRTLALRRSAVEQDAPADAATEAESQLALERAISRLKLLLSQQRERAAETPGDAAGHVDVLLTFDAMLDDARLRERVLEISASGATLPAALSVVAGEAGRAAARTRDEYTISRSQALSDLCEAVILVLRDGGPAFPRGTVLIAERPTVVELLLARPSAVVLTGACRTAADQALASLLNVPTVANVSGLFRWVADGDTVIVDADHGLVRVNPSRAEIARLREEQRESKTSVASGEHHQQEKASTSRVFPANGEA